MTTAQLYARTHRRKSPLAHFLRRAPKALSRRDSVSTAQCVLCGSAVQLTFSVVEAQEGGEDQARLALLRAGVGEADAAVLVGLVLCELQERERVAALVPQQHLALVVEHE